jgi:hypothetical protein
MYEVVIPATGVESNGLYQTNTNITDNITDYKNKMKNRHENILMKLLVANKTHCVSRNDYLSRRIMCKGSKQCFSKSSSRSNSDTSLIILFLR